ncbi:actin-domain-containing protein [Trametes versicolor FP-101664 SS1]|uniref:actin-domain-containing protein n=1 Tax=Trametes versicolor (strain FP-101664) TaxID=717944 RepID=UPI0004622898|nr:actin-domain-containing protein [Trametes versicolor FP-101664 SS1]EIW57670.1 actin-domain-containing protein [Trametes versicolor FP-101664 SS1]
MSGVPATPRRTAHESATPAATPQTTRVAASHTVQASPHYQTTRRHSLYGTEDRIILDPGSRLWKVGFSGEGKPRDVFLAEGETGQSLWTLNRASNPVEREEEDRVLEAKLQACLRAVFHNSLLTDPKSRKVILVEHPLLPLHIKEIIARVLFNNLQVPSISFASSHLLALLAAGRVTGLVLDCGHLETTVLPVYSFRPLYPHLRTTPLAGSRLSTHIKALLLMFGTYIPPATSLSAAMNIPAASRSVRVPQDVLTDKVIDEIKTRCCFVGDPLETDANAGPSGSGRASSPSAGGDGSELDPPPSEPALSESEFSRVSADMDSSFSHAASSGYSVVSHSQLTGMGGSGGDAPSRVQALATMYGRHSTATDIHMRVDPPPAQQTGTGRGTLIVPGWIRERAAEVLFEGGDVDESSVAEVILDCLLKVPVDLRKTLASTILVVGGTPMLPGFIPRLQAELVRAVSRPITPSSSPPSRAGRPRPATYDRYASLRPLLPYFAILNNPSPPPPASANAAANAGKAPAFTPGTMAWVGGSLAGALKTGGVEVQREKWDEAETQPEVDEDVLMEDEPPRLVVSSGNILPDWTRTPLPVGAPPAPRPPSAAPPPALQAQSVAG